MRSRGVHSVQIAVEVPFFDVDMMQVVWHGHYVKYLEQARCALLAELGHDYPAMLASGYAWPVIDMQLRYVQPAVFGQHLTVRAELVEWESRLKIHYLITDAASGTRLTRASTVQVAVDIATREMQLVSPPAMRIAIERRLAELGALR
ncbi:acyl-CoA thioesterase [Pseudothauera rhizosphaerae]|uniref:Acyl-CoA thioesterase n=1 Tax=Pseudothauera rhizosphaerae TaxID=2565932 RepID=A0A4S4ARS8_9RHOO|nr:acyl-CoA thioesterase [Pseudothauera rhizosphaerae]THF62500.1 acyl-CoA thioesterase [Pseudothauera rhizosphaerae]